MDNLSSEITKYAANAFLAAKISFMNEISQFCEVVGADVNDVRKGVGTDHRIGEHFLYPGVGYGGSCFPKDVKALARRASEVGVQLHLVHATDKVNSRQKRVLIEKAIEHYGGTEAFRGKTFGIWGLAFKPETDDMREAPSIVVIEELLSLGAKVRVYDPEAMNVAKRIFGDRVEYASSSYEALTTSSGGCDGLFIITEWEEFKRPNFRKIQQLLKEPIIFDGRNLFDPRSMSRLGFTYHSIGRSSIVLGRMVDSEKSISKKIVQKKF